MDMLQLSESSGDAPSTCKPAGECELGLVGREREGIDILVSTWVSTRHDGTSLPPVLAARHGSGSLFATGRHAEVFFAKSISITMKLSPSILFCPTYLTIYNLIRWHSAQENGCLLHGI